MTNCSHAATEPVEVRDLLTPGETTVVAWLCVECGDRLPAEWGCGDCEWIEDVTLGDRLPNWLLGRPCAEHARARL